MICPWGIHTDQSYFCFFQKITSTLWSIILSGSEIKWSPCSFPDPFFPVLKMSVILDLSSAQEPFVSYDFSKITDNSLVMALATLLSILRYISPVSMDVYLSHYFKHSLAIFFLNSVFPFIWKEIDLEAGKAEARTDQWQLREGRTNKNKQTPLSIFVFLFPLSPGNLLYWVVGSNFS